MSATKRRRSAKARSAVPRTPAAARAASPVANGEVLLSIITDLGRLGSLRDPIVSFDGIDLTAPQMHAVMWLGTDGAMPIGALAQRMHSSPPTMTGVIDRLEREGIAVRVRVPDDRRAVLVKLTPKGEDLHKRARVAMLERLDRMLTLLGEQDALALVQIMSRLREAMRGAVGGA